MKKLLLLTLLSCNFFALSSQEKIDKVKHRFVYEVVFTNTLESGKAKDIQNLDVGEHSSHYYSWLNRRNEEIIDSINRSGSVSIDMVRKATKGLKGQSHHVYKDFPEVGKLTYIHGYGTQYIYDEPKAKLNWRMEDIDSTLLGYRCQAATTELRGRTWRVWFTEEIPIADGPWKLWGLPGLILKADDVEGYYSFNCIAIENGNDEDITFSRKDMVACSPLDLQRIVVRSLHESVHVFGEKFAEQFIREYGGDGYETPVIIENYEKE